MGISRPIYRNIYSDNAAPVFPHIDKVYLFFSTVSLAYQQLRRRKDTLEVREHNINEFHVKNGDKRRGKLKNRISICGELGGGSTEIGQMLSRRLGVKCMNSSDAVKNIVIGFKISFKQFEEDVRSGKVNLDKMIQGEIDELSELGEFIVEGRSAFMLLNDEDVFKVLLVAPETIRAKRISEMRNIMIEEAEEAIRLSDKERKSMVEKLFKKYWLDPQNYDMVINTRSRSYKEAADLIAKAIQEQFNLFKEREENTVPAILRGLSVS